MDVDSSVKSVCGNYEKAAKEFSKKGGANKLSFPDPFIEVPTKITFCRHQIEIRMYENQLYKDAWEELERVIESAQKQRKEENMKTNIGV